MWLRYGVDLENSLIAIEDVPRGKTSLLCPYCGGRLTAKKGRIKEHHFAHTEETCRFVAERNNQEIPILPLYDSFNIRLSSKELEQLKTLWRQYGAKGYRIPKFLVPRRFIWLRLLQEPELPYSSSEYEFTQLGLIPFGELSLTLFNQVQEPLLLEKLSELEDKAERASTLNSLFLAERLTDLRLYRAQLKKILLQSLYYLEVTVDGDTLYKIGVTQRPIEERVAEVQRSLRSHFKAVSIKLLGVWAHRGNVEKYFKHRYQDFNHPIGSLTEYYKFNSAEDIKVILRDLRRMKPKVLCQAETDILEGKLPQIEAAVQSE
jgi:hypothetical protein